MKNKLHLQSNLGHCSLQGEPLRITSCLNKTFHIFCIHVFWLKSTVSGLGPVMICDCVCVCVLFCRDSSVCPDRHRFISHLDQSVLPASGLIEVRTFTSLSLFQFTVPLFDLNEPSDSSAQRTLLYRTSSFKQIKLTRIN